MKREHALGIHAVQALAMHAPERIIRVWIKKGGGRLAALEERLADAGVNIERMESDRLDCIAGGQRHQGVIAEFRPQPPIDQDELDARVARHGDHALILVLDEVQDPHNLGACVRTAAAAGATAVVIPARRSATLSPAVRRAAAGATEHVPLAVVTNLARCLRALKDRGVWCIGLDADGERSVFDCRFDGPVALIAGSEERGLRRLTRENCDVLTRIPMPGTMESLNVSVSVGIALFSAVRQREKG